MSVPKHDPAAGGFGGQLSKKPHDVVDESWAGGVSAQYEVVPRVRVGRYRWLNLPWLVPLAAVDVAKGLRTTPGVADFVAERPGTVLPAGAESGAGFPPGSGGSTS